ncbi:hypothetical protein LZ30DRAFT_740047 [Colletotrichum cereale]|nr:hypothetical protein LZ30DRAFT_740047 [Colletotrichum cereale]
MFNITLATLFLLPEVDDHREPPLLAALWMICVELIIVFLSIWILFERSLRIRIQQKMAERDGKMTEHEAKLVELIAEFSESSPSYALIVPPFSLLLPASFLFLLILEPLCPDSSYFLALFGIQEIKPEEKKPHASRERLRKPPTLQGHDTNS